MCHLRSLFNVNGICSGINIREFGSSGSFECIDSIVGNGGFLEIADFGAILNWAQSTMFLAMECFRLY